MTRNSWIVISASALLCSGMTPIKVVAQKAAASSPVASIALLESPAMGGQNASSSAPGSEPGAQEAEDAGATSATATATAASPSASYAAPLTNDEVMKAVAE